MRDCPKWHGAMPRYARYSLKQEYNVEQRAVLRRRSWDALEGGTRVSLEESDGLLGLQRQAPEGFEEQVHALRAELFGYGGAAVELRPWQSIDRPDSGDAARHRLRDSESR